MYFYKSYDPTLAGGHGINIFGTKIPAVVAAGEDIFDKHSVTIVLTMGEMKDFIPDIRAKRFYVAMRGKACKSYQGLIGMPGGKVEKDAGCREGCSACVIIDTAITELGQETGIVRKRGDIFYLWNEKLSNGWTNHFVCIGACSEFPQHMEVREEKIASGWFPLSTLSCKNGDRRYINSVWAVPTRFEVMLARQIPYVLEDEGVVLTFHADQRIGQRTMGWQENIPLKGVSPLITLFSGIHEQLLKTRLGRNLTWIPGDNLIENDPHSPELNAWLGTVSSVRHFLSLGNVRTPGQTF